MIILENSIMWNLVPQCLTAKVFTVKLFFRKLKTQRIENRALIFFAKELEGVVSKFGLPE
jgi:hypothetical protein